MKLPNLIFNLSLSSFAIVCWGTSVLASNGYAPHQMNFNGYLTDSTSGLPNSGTYDMRFVLYENGVAAWAAEYTTVVVSNGQFSVVLGDVPQGGGRHHPCYARQSGADLQRE